MATEKQRAAAKRNVRKAQAGAKKKQTLDIKGRSKMGKAELKRAVARAKP
jgi:hypothetical protein